MEEIEIRAIVDNKLDIINNLKKIGFKKKKETCQHDIMLDKEDASLFRSGKKIRIRVEEEYAVLTYKGDLTKQKDISKREELNIPIDKNDVNKFISFLTELGYPMCFQIKKNREIYINDNIQVTFDLWPIIGCMMEIEGDEESIKEVALKVAPNIKFSNYRLKELFENKMKETGKSLEELKQDYFDKVGFDLGNIELIIK